MAVEEAGAMLTTLAKAYLKGQDIDSAFRVRVAFLFWFVRVVRRWWRDTFKSRTTILTCTHNKLPSQSSAQTPPPPPPTLVTPLSQ